MLAIYGAGGFALQIFDLIESAAAFDDQVCFVDDRPMAEVFGLPVRAPMEIDPDDPELEIVIAIANPRRRKEIAAQFTRFRTLQASTSIVSRHAIVGEGAILAHATWVEAGVTIGRQFHGNIYSYIAHETVIGNFVTFAPRVNCNGAVQIGDCAYIGAGATIRQGLRIGKGAVVGMGAVVTKDVAPFTTVVGNPARPLERSVAGPAR